MMGESVIEHGGRQNVRMLTFGERAAYVGGGDGEQHGVNGVGPYTFGNRAGSTGTAGDQEVDGARDVLPAVPGAEFCEGVGADQEEEAGAGGEGGANALDGVDGVAAFGELFETRRLETSIAGDGEFDHAQAVRIRRVGSAVFVRRVRSGDEEHEIEREAVGGFAGNRQVRVVNGIESAAEDCESQGLSILTELMRTSLTGRSPVPRGTSEMRLTTS